jgi:uncharacterized alkaline shock family protein YloU
MDGHSVISPEVVARYARDAAAEVDGVTRVVKARVDGERVVLALAVGWGAPIPEVGAAVQRHVADFLERMTDVRPAAVDVVVEDAGAAA